MMKTNFFSQVADLKLCGVLNINLTNSTNGNMVVSIFLENQQCVDTAKELIPPLTLNASAVELDELFFDTISKPMQTVSGVMVDMDAFMQQLERAKAHSECAKKQTEKQNREQDAESKKLRLAWEKVDQLEAEGKFREAWTKVPDPAKYPECAEQIRKRRTALAARFEPDLFAANEPGSQPDMERK